MPAADCQSAGGCPNKISEVDYQLGHRQCRTCRWTGEPLATSLEPVEIIDHFPETRKKVLAPKEEPVATPKKKTEAIDAEAGIQHAATNGKAPISEVIVSHIQQRAGQAFWQREDEAAAILRDLADEVRELVKKLEGEG